MINTELLNIKSMKDNNKLVRLLTYNEIRNILGGNYNTIKKIVDKFVSKNDIKIGIATKQNRDYTAFCLTNENLAEIQNILQNIKKSCKTTKTQHKIIKNNELENKIKLLEANLKDKEIEKEKLKNEKIKVEVDLYKAKSDILLITDKQKTFENNYFEQKQQNESLIKENKKQSNIINILSGVLIVLVTVILTLQF